MTTRHERKPRGLYGKFHVTRTDGKHEPGQKHDGCTYFAIDLDHDDHAPAALAAYARSCREKGEGLELAAELEEALRCGPCGCRSFDECHHLLLPQSLAAYFKERTS